jgi:hypothetical protein
VRLRDELCDPDAEDENGDQSGSSAHACADRLDEVDFTNDHFVLFLRMRESIFAQKELVGFMLRELPAIDHQADKGGDENAPDNGHYSKCAHDGIPQERIV